MPQNIIFDLGGVLVDWDPRRLYRKIFGSDQEVEYFLNHICTMDWNEAQDAGRTIEEATQILTEVHPDYQQEIKAYYERWEEMLGGQIQGTVELLEALHKKGKQRLFALTNWSAETFPIALERFAFLATFEGILVSGQEGIKKPDPAIYQLLCDRFNIQPEDALFIDDSQRNVDAANAFGIPAIRFTSPDELKIYLEHNQLI